MLVNGNTNGSCSEYTCSVERGKKKEKKEMFGLIPNERELTSFQIRLVNEPVSVG